MSKPYNLNKKSDVNRLARDLEKAVLNQARSAVNDMNYDVSCPHCNQQFSAHAGINLCPFCQKEVKLNLNINF